MDDDFRNTSQFFPCSDFLRKFFSICQNEEYIDNFSKLQIARETKFSFQKIRDLEVQIGYISLFNDKSYYLRVFCSAKSGYEDPDILTSYYKQTELDDNFLNYKEFIRNQFFIMESYLYYLPIILRDINLKVFGKSKDRKKFRKIKSRRMYNRIEPIFNYLKFKMKEGYNDINYDFLVVLHLTGEKDNLVFSDGLCGLTIHFDKYGKLKNFISNSCNKELIFGKINKRFLKINPDCILIIYNERIDVGNLANAKEILRKAIMDTLLFSNNFLILLDKTFPLLFLPEIIERSFAQSRL